MSNRIDFVVRKYRLGESVFIEAEHNGKKLGHGKLMSDECLARFIKADPSGDCKYLDWMIFMAGGGQDVMDKALRLWNGEKPDDPNSLRNLCRKDFIAEQVNGHNDDNGVYYPPVSIEQAERTWAEKEQRHMFEFIMGDQDIAAEDGYGFFREWPGKDGVYERVVNVVQMWHNAQPKLLAKNKIFDRAERLRTTPHSLWSKEDSEFMAKHTDNPVKERVVLDLYAKWKPNEYSQKDAVYNTLASVLDKLTDFRRAQLLKDDRHEVIYDDEHLRVICPLTIGASIKFGSSKWCVSNRSEFDRSIDGNVYGTGHNWKSYTQRGPLVYLLFKVPMPVWCSKLAIHIPEGDLPLLSTRIYALAWYDVLNAPNTSYKHSDFVERLRAEHEATDAPMLPMTPDERALAYGNRPFGPAWTHPITGKLIETSIAKAIGKIIEWGKTFNRKKVVIDYLLDVGGVIK